MTYSFPYLEPVCCSMSSSNCGFLTCIQISQVTGQVVWYSHILKNFPQFIVIHTVKGFGIVNKAKVDVFLEFPCFFNDTVSHNTKKKFFLFFQCYISKSKIFSIPILCLPDKDIELCNYHLNSLPCHLPCLEF